MRIEQKVWTKKNGLRRLDSHERGDVADLVLVFGATAKFKTPETFHEIRALYPNASILGCTTAGEILGTDVRDDSLAITAIQFEKTTLALTKIHISDYKNSAQAGRHLADNLDTKGLKHIFLLSDGLKVNGTELIAGLTDKLPNNIPVTGGLSGDGGRFQETYVMGNCPAEKETIVLLALYGAKLRVGYGSMGGWDPFGPERVITKSKGNVLYEMDGKSALELYKKYLGKHAEGLPATALLFPLSLRIQEGKPPVVRTILSVDEEEQSLTFAGDMPEGSYAKLMKANMDRLIDGAVGAAEISSKAVQSKESQLAVLISCVGRKMVLKQRGEEEVEGVQDKLGNHTKLTGFYSYGEIAPFSDFMKCELHNQTITITTISEH